MIDNYFYLNFIKHKIHPKSQFIKITIPLRLGEILLVKA